MRITSSWNCEDAEVRDSRQQAQGFDSGFGNFTEPCLKTDFKRISIQLANPEGSSKAPCIERKANGWARTKIS